MKSSQRQTRLRRLVASAGSLFVAVVTLQVVGMAAAEANAPNPQPTTAGTATVNSDGTVTASLSGTWTWPGQACAGRYGEDWAVDWWGISGSKLPANNFSLTNATEVPGPGQNTTGTISAVGSIQIPHTTSYFHVPRYYGGETVNSASTCTDTGSGGSVVSSGSWSASATYPSASDIPAQVCVILYDPHGKQGVPSKNTSDYDTIKDHDNSIQTNAFDPTAGGGFCVGLQFQQTIQGEIYQCINGQPSTTLVSGGTLAVASQGISSSNPLAPTSVPAGTYSMDATVSSSLQFVACGQSGVVIDDPTHAHQSVTVPQGGAGDGVFYAQTPAPPQMGYLEICKSSANGVSGTFNFVVNGSTNVSVPAGACAAAIQVPVGNTTVHENRTTGFSMQSASTSPASRLVSVDAPNGDVVVTVLGGGISQQTILTVTNRPVRGTVKICEIAGTGVAQNTSFTFTNSANSQVTTVPAGPAPGGYCVVASGTFTGGTQLTITQNIPAGDRVTAISVTPHNRLVGTANKQLGKVTILIGGGVTEVTFTDASG